MAEAQGYVIEEFSSIEQWATVMLHTETVKIGIRNGEEVKIQIRFLLKDSMKPL